VVLARRVLPVVSSLKLKQISTLEQKTMALVRDETVFCQQCNMNTAGPGRVQGVDHPR